MSPLEKPEQYLSLVSIPARSEPLANRLQGFLAYCQAAPVRTRHRHQLLRRAQRLASLGGLPERLVALEHVGKALQELGRLVLALETARQPDGEPLETLRRASQGDIDEVFVRLASDEHGLRQVGGLPAPLASPESPVRTMECAMEAAARAVIASWSATWRDSATAWRRFGAVEKAARHGAAAVTLEQARTPPGIGFLKGVLGTAPPVGDGCILPRSTVAGLEWNTSGTVVPLTAVEVTEAVQVAYRSVALSRALATQFSHAAAKNVEFVIPASALRKLSREDARLLRSLADG